MRGYRLRPTEYEVEELAPGPMTPDPALQRSVLGVSWGTLTAYVFPDCRTCDVRQSCMQSAVKLGPFAEAQCEMALESRRDLKIRRGSVAERILPVIQAHPEGLKLAGIQAVTGLANSSILAALPLLEQLELVWVDRSDGRAMRIFPVLQG